MTRGERVDTIVYGIGDQVYVNLTNRCTNRCTFCVRDRADGVGGHDLRLAQDAAPEEVCSALAPHLTADVVYCGFGEPMLNLPSLLASAKQVKDAGGTVRINTNGHADLIYGRRIAPELAGLVDEVSISLNAPDAESYAELTQCVYGPRGFDALIAFAIDCLREGIAVTLTVVDCIPDEDIAKCRELASRLGCQFRVRPFVP